MITFREIKFLVIALIFGICYWFVMVGAVTWWKDNFPSISTLLVGVLGLVTLLILYKYRGLLNLN